MKDKKSSNSSEKSMNLSVNLIEKIENYKKFLNDYEKLSHDTFSEQISRSTVIQKGINQVNDLMKDIEKKIAIWINNDPMLTIDSSKLEPSLVLVYVPRWPLLVHLFSACFCLGCSTLYHLM